MPEVTLNLGPTHVDKYREGVEAILRGPAPSSENLGNLQLRYKLALPGVKMEQIVLLRTLVGLAKEDVDMTIIGLDDDEMYLFMEFGKLLQDLSETYKERGLF